MPVIKLSLPLVLVYQDYWVVQDLTGLGASNQVVIAIGVGLTRLDLVPVIKLSLVLTRLDWVPGALPVINQVVIAIGVGLTRLDWAVIASLTRLDVIKLSLPLVLV